VNELEVASGADTVTDAVADAEAAADAAALNAPGTLCMKQSSSSHAAVTDAAAVGMLVVTVGSGVPAAGEVGSDVVLMVGRAGKDAAANEEGSTTTVTVATGTREDTVSAPTKWSKKSSSTRWWCAAAVKATEGAWAEADGVKDAEADGMEDAELDALSAPTKRSRNSSSER
jgi:hypothetical protein